jgi:hypothetical protein
MPLDFPSVFGFSRGFSPAPPALRHHDPVVRPPPAGGAVYARTVAPLEGESDELVKSAARKRVDIR